MNKYYGLFGNFSPGRFAEIQAADLGEALAEMRKQFGNRWSIMLDEGQFQIYLKQHKMHEKKLGISEGGQDASPPDLPHY